MLRSCFGINKDMVRVIANAAVAALVSMATEGGGPTGGALAGVGRGIYIPTRTTMRQGGRGVKRTQSRQHDVGRASFAIVVGNNGRREPLLPPFLLAAPATNEPKT